MKVIIENDKAIEIPLEFLAQFKSSILKNSNLYQKLFENFVLENVNNRFKQFKKVEKIETDKAIYRLKFEPFVELDYILVKVIEFKKFKKN